MRVFSITAALTWLLAWVARNLPLLATGVDANGMPFGGDFLAFWTAGRMALEGRAAACFEPDVFFAAQDAALAGNQAHFLWNYPPPMLVLVSPLGLLGFFSAAVLWWVITVPLYAGALYRVMPRWETVVCGFAASAALLNLAHGQNGFLLTGVFVLGLAMLHRPLLAGALLGLLTLKPHFAVLVPLALIVGQHWRALAGFVSSALGLCLLSLGFGTGVWVAFFENLPRVRESLAGGTFPFGKLVSPYATSLTLGAPESLALGVHGVGVLFAAGLVALAWRRGGDRACAVLLAATPLISPYFYDYDLLLWSGAAVFAVRARAVTPWIWVVGALVPIALQPLWESSGVQFGGFACLGLLALLSLPERR